MKKREVVEYGFAARPHFNTVATLPCEMPNYDFWITQGSVATVLR